MPVISYNFFAGGRAVGILEEYIFSIFLYVSRWVANNITGYLGTVEGMGEGHMTV